MGPNCSTFGAGKRKKTKKPLHMGSHNSLRHHSSKWEETQLSVRERGNG